MIQQWEITKSNKSKCKSCSFEGTTIPKNSLRLRRWTGMGTNTHTEFLCQHCGKRAILEQIKDLRKLVNQLEITTLDCPF